MINIEKIRQTAEGLLENTDIYIIDIKCSPSNEIEVLIDSDSSVSIDSCIELSRAIDAQFDREQEDFELTVASSGVGQPLKVLRQYLKLIEKPVEVVFKNGTKMVATLTEATESSITLSYTERVAIEGKKRKEEVTRTTTFMLDELKSTKEFIDFK